MLRAVNIVMAALFAFAVAVQYNDPDPLRWAAIYGAASVASAWAAVRGSAPFPATLVIALVALVWGLIVMQGETGRLGVFAHMFDAWEMKSLPIEEAREASGLLIVVVWMTVLAAGAWRTKTRRDRASTRPDSSHV